MDDADRIRWARALTVAGWLFLLAYIGIVIFVVRRAAATTTASFEDGLWWQRVEQISSAAVPQNVMVLVPAAAAAIGGTVLVRSIVDRTVIRLEQLTRVVAGVSLLVVVLATLGIIGVFFRNFDEVADLQAILLRLGGACMAIGVVRLALESERSV